MAATRVSRPGALALALVLSSSLGFAASPEETAAARAAAQAGLAAFKKGSYEEAYDRFERAEGLVHSPVHWLYQARSSEKLGNLVRARELYIKLAREELDAKASRGMIDAKAAAEDALPALEARLPYVTLTVKGEEADAAKVTMDGAPVASAVIGIPFPVNPGEHRFVARASGTLEAAAALSLAEGQKESLTLELKGQASQRSLGSAPEEARSPSARGQDTAASDASSRAWMKPAGWVSLAVGVVGTGLGAYLYYDGNRKTSQAEDDYAACRPDCTAQSEAIESLESDGTGEKNLSLGTFAVGGIGLAAGVTLLLLAPKTEKTVGFIPLVTTEQVGVVGRF